MAGTVERLHMSLNIFELYGIWNEVSTMFAVLGIVAVWGYTLTYTTHTFRVCAEQRWVVFDIMHSQCMEWKPWRMWFALIIYYFTMRYVRMQCIVSAAGWRGFRSMSKMEKGVGWTKISSAMSFECEKLMPEGRHVHSICICCRSIAGIAVAANGSGEWKLKTIKR